MVGSIRAYPSVRDLPEPVDLAVIAVPRDAVLGVVDACAERGVKALVVITAGFAEVGAEAAPCSRRWWTRSAATACAWSGPTAWGC